MMKRPTTYLSIFATLAFAAWVIVMWWPTPVQEKAEKPKPVQQIEKSEKPQTQTAQTVLTLPAPPPPAAPKSISVPAAEPVVQNVEVVKPTPKPEPKPKVVEKQKPKPKPALKSVEVVKKPEPIKKPIPKPKPIQKAPKPEPKTIEATAVTAQEGRALLRVLEHGKGPLIEIAWPSSSTQRNKLYQAFKSCYGMQNAVMDVRGDLYRSAEPSGQRWEINLDRFSGFLREASGQMSAQENQKIRQITQRHERLFGANPVRIFPRTVDASLLGGFNRLLGENYQKAQSIQATYEIEGRQVYVSKIRMNGSQQNGRIKLLGYVRC